jgi:hypothetical protein
LDAPLIHEELRIRHWDGDRRFTREELGGRNLCYFSALKNLQELGIDNLQVSSFIPGLRQYFGHLSPTLRFLALSEPIGSSRQIVYFIGLFPNLQDLKLHYSDLKNCHENVADTTLIPLSSPPLRGRLTLIFFTREQIVKDMITLFGGLRFHHMDLFGVKCLPLLLEKCAETLETLRLYPTDPYGEAFSSGEEAVDSTERSAAKRMCFNLSQNKILRTLEITAESIVIAGDAAPGFLKTVLSSVAFPGILEVVIIYRENDLGGWPPRQSCKPDPVYFPDYLLGVWCFPNQLMVFREMHSVRDFRLVFCVDVHGCMVDVGMEILGSVVEMEWVGGRFGSLVCKPVVIYERRTIRTRFTDQDAGSRWETALASAL